MTFDPACQIRACSSVPLILGPPSLASFNMPAKRSRSPTGPSYDERVLEACDGYRRGIYKTLTATAGAQRVRIGTVRNRLHGFTQSRTEAQAKNRLLNPEQEAVLVEWLKYRSLIALPADYAQIRQWVCKLTGILPGKKWVADFLKDHPDLVNKKAAPLDPKRANAFTQEVYDDHVQKLQAIEEMFNIKTENKYNMDEKCLQLGGGRGNATKKFMFDRNQRHKCRMKSDNLKMVTVIEAVCADGSAPIGPGFVSPPGDTGDWADMVISGIEATAYVLCFSPDSWSVR